MRVLCGVGVYSRAMTTLPSIDGGGAPDGRVGGVCGDERGLARRVLGESHDLALMMRWNYARALSKDDRATHGDLREAVTTLEETGRTARRVLGGAHPTTVGVERDLRSARDALYARGLP